jgi:hypothetical protein
VGEAAPLRRPDFEDIQAHVDLAADLFAANGLTLGTSGDMDAFAAFISGEKHSWGASASHNPLHSYLTPANAFWVYLEERTTGVKVASCTQKVVRTENFIADIFSHTLYDTRKPVLDGRLPEFHDGADEAEFAFSGNVVYGSGLYIRPDYRAKGLIILSRLARTIALRHFKAHHFVGIQRLTESSRFHALERQHFAHCKPFVKGMPYKWDGSFQISWSSRAEWLEAIRQELRDAGRYRRGPLHFPESQRAAEAISDSRA